jgi:hypothetical protein
LMCVVFDCTIGLRDWNRVKLLSGLHEHRQHVQSRSTIDLLKTQDRLDVDHLWVSVMKALD